MYDFFYVLVQFVFGKLFLLRILQIFFIIFSDWKLLSSFLWGEMLGGQFSWHPADTPEPVLDFGPERGSAKGTIADLGPFLGT